MNLLVTGAWQGAKDGIEQLKTLGHQVEFLQFEKDELPCSYEWVEGVICNGLFLSHPIERFTHLKYIQLTSAGFDRVDMQYLYSDAAQRIAAKHYYRPTNSEILKEYADVFDLNIDLVSIQDFGGWDEAQKVHFSDGGIFDQIYEK